MCIAEMYSVMVHRFIEALANIPGINKIVITFKTYRLWSKLKLLAIWAQTLNCR